MPKISLDKRRVRHIMLDLEVTQKQLADRSGLSEGTIANLLNGKGLRLDTLGRLAAALGVEPGELLIQEDCGDTGRNSRVPGNVRGSEPDPPPHIPAYAQ